MGRHSRGSLGIGVRTIGTWEWYIPTTSEKLIWAVKILPPERNESPKFRVETVGKGAEKYLKSADYAMYEGTDLFELERQAEEDTYARTPLDWSRYLRIETGIETSDNRDENASVSLSFSRIETATRERRPEEKDEYDGDEEYGKPEKYWREFGSRRTYRGDARYESYRSSADKPAYTLIPDTPENYDALVSIVNGLNLIGARIKELLSQKNVNKTLAGVRTSGMRLLAAPEPAIKTPVKPKKVKSRVIK
jgi:hypothetical protein